MALAKARACWICGETHLRSVKPDNRPDGLGVDAFRITDSNYGRTGEIFRCETCGFHQCSDMRDVLHHYVNMADERYEATRSERALQERALLRFVAAEKPRGRLLDVGAGSGILVEQAIAMGYDAVGLEPSRALQERAAALGLPVKLGVLPHREIAGRFDIVTCVDVIEHVPDPIGLLKDIAELLSDDGIAAIVTPDRGSFAARIMGWRWWHYRVAHIGYFDRDTLTRASQMAGLQITNIARPGWYFPADYILERLLRYLPLGRRIKLPTFLRKIVISLNLRDSLTAICRIQN